MAIHSTYILSTKSNVVSNDGISRDMLLLTLPRIFNVITAMINRSIILGEVSSQWERASVTPLAKIDQTTDL